MKSRSIKPFQNAVFALPREQSHWSSNRSIAKNILSCYRKLSPQLQTLWFRWRFVENLPNAKIHRMIFTESDPHFGGLQRLRDQLTEYYYHIYGDFTCQTPEWRDLIRILQGKRVKFVVASEAQRRLLVTFLGEKNKRCLEVIPFPISPRKVSFSARSLEKSRQELGFEEDDFVLTYVGRVSQQKNVNLLLEFVEQFIRRNPSFGKRLKIAIAGGFDDIGEYFANQKPGVGEYADAWSRWYSRIPEHFRKKVHLLGFLNPAQLRTLHEATDAFTSLSTFHDEDYGMAPLEALCAGVPTILSAWGGYLDFASENPKNHDVQLVDVRIGKRGLELDYSGFEQALLFLLKRKENSSERRIRASRFRKIYSVLSIAEKYLQSHKKPFRKLNAYSPALDLHADRLIAMRNGKGAVFSSYSGKDAFYRKIYRAYLKPRK